MEICQEFRETINRSICDYEFFSEVIGDFLSKRNFATDIVNFKYSYVRNEWKEYESRFYAVKNAETREALIKLLLLTLITQRRKIDSIKEATKL